MTELDTLKQENKMLKETGSISKKEANEFRNAESLLKNQIKQLNDDKQNMNTLLKKREMELALANK